MPSSLERYLERAAELDHLGRHEDPLAEARQPILVERERQPPVTDGALLEAINAALAAKAERKLSRCFGRCGPRSGDDAALQSHRRLTEPPEPLKGGLDLLHPHRVDVIPATSLLAYQRRPGILPA
ncbi:MAG: hypothetical protein JO211_13860 [Acidobacteriaceae bacterium]|nr:hypothetical protein [Acidobacteriaceae bacterium]